MLCFMSKAIIRVVFTGLTILVVSSRIKISDPRMNNQETWHLVDECVLSPLHGSVEVTPEDSVSNASQVILELPPLHHLRLKEEERQKLSNFKPSSKTTCRTS